MTACFVTGHRPSGFRYSEQDPRCDKIKSIIKTEIIKLYTECGIRAVWVGGAIGVDTWAAEIVLELQKQKLYKDLQLFVAIPFPEYGKSFDPDQKQRYLDIIQKSTKQITLCPLYRPDAFRKRNRYIVDNSICGIAVFGKGRSVRSGTKMTLNYGIEKKGLPVTVIDPDSAQVTPLCIRENNSDQT